MQIHALHNIRELLTVDDEKCAELLHENNLEIYEEKCNQLEWKYLSTYANTLNNVRLTYENTLKSLREHNDIAKNYIEIISNYLCAFNRNDEKRLIDKVHEDYNVYSSCAKQDKVKNLKLTEIRSIPSLLYTLDQWYDNISTVTKKIMEQFQSLDFFYENVSPKNDVKPETWSRILNIVQTVCDCHLNNAVCHL